MNDPMHRAETPGGVWGGGGDTPLPFWRKLASSGKGQQIVGPISANKNHLTLPPNNQV